MHFPCYKYKLGQWERQCVKILREPSQFITIISPAVTAWMDQPFTCAMLARMKCSPPTAAPVLMTCYFSSLSY